MGFKGQFITVLPKRQAVVVMTGILPTDGGLRTATYLNLYRRMVNDYILPAMEPGNKLESTEASQQILARSLHCATRSFSGSTRVEAASTLSDCVHTRGLHRRESV